MLDVIVIDMILLSRAVSGYHCHGTADSAISSNTDIIHSNDD